MPWKESSAVEERLRVVARLIEGEAMTDLCLEFGISRRTGYKIFNRCKEEGWLRFKIAPAGRCMTPIRSRPRLRL